MKKKMEEGRIVTMWMINTEKNLKEKELDK